MADGVALTWYTLKFAAGTFLALFFVFLILVSVALVSDGVARRCRRGRGGGEGRSGIYAGRVWHARFKPTAHRFSYPIFYCLLDLDELDVTFPWYIWPVGSARLPALARFRSSDHLKGKGSTSEAAGAENNSAKGFLAVGGVARAGGIGRGRNGRACGESTATATSSLPLRRHAERVRDIVEEATGARPTGRVQLLTHLAYLGYCFNPVSFYYCLEKTEREIETVVAEVSNTPWGEMHCYVLSPRAKGVQVISKDKRSNDDGIDNNNNNHAAKAQGHVRYRFEKDFHVSPFMSMKHTYDWKFTAPNASPGSGLMAQTTLLEPGGDGGKVFFDAKLVLKRQPSFSAAALCWHMTVYPLYTVWVQILIHYQAFWLWWKQVPFFPHPEGAETAASRFVGFVMTPLFNAQAAWDKRRRRRQTKSTCDGDGQKAKAA